MAVFEFCGASMSDLKERAEEIFLDGECYALAMAASQGTGWPMVGLMEDGVIRHALVQRPDGLLHDVRGPVEVADAGKPFGIKSPDIRPITEADLLARRPVDNIGFALKVAMALWPDLPWREGTMHARVLAFTTELEEVCRRHGIWLRGHVHTMPPVLAEAFGDEAGYTITTTDDGMAYQINRRFSRYEAPARTSADAAS